MRGIIYILSSYSSNVDADDVRIDRYQVAGQEEKRRKK